MLNQQYNEGQIHFQKQDFSIQVETIKDKKDYTKQNRIHIAGLLEDEIDKSEIFLEENKIRNEFVELKERFSDVRRFSFKIEYNIQNKNFWVLI